MNYDNEMMKIINNLDYTPNLLLHSCCAPCSSACITRLKDYFNITIIYYNPNIEPYEEYEKRKQEQIRLIKLIDSKNKIDIIDCDYDNDIYHKITKGHEMDKEKGPRCYICYKQRLEYTAKKAKELNFDYFATTLSVSPYKISRWINEIGLDLMNEYNIKFLPADFKKKNGYKLSIELSNKYNLYRQNYCGCIYSKRDTNI
jgi:predicted adenine nucleotide alpha hydrolase (AANH) superfamily ATPase